MEFFKLCCALVFLFIFSVGPVQGQCTYANVSVAQNGTGVWIHGKPEFEVTVSNNCPCTQQNLKLNCTGFQTEEGYDKAVFLPDGDSCLINGGNPVHPYQKISFNYAWDTKFPLAPISSQISCSLNGDPSANGPLR